MNGAISIAENLNMDKLQQEIKDFHEKLKPVLEKILRQYDNKKVQKIYNTIIYPCRKLMQKCSFKSVSDTTRLCRLAYWLYIYGDKEAALELCTLAHNVDFSLEYWDYGIGIQNIYGLEIRIARELLGEDRRNDIPPAMLEYYFSKRVKKELKYPKILREEEIAGCSCDLLDTELLRALADMIGMGETGMYTELNDNWDKIQEAVDTYIDCLKIVAF